MNEEFAIKLKMVMDQSSIASIKEQLSAFGEEASEGVHISPPHATEMFDIPEMEEAQEHYWEIQQILAKIADLQTTLSWDGLSSQEIIDINAEIEKLLAKLKKLTSGENEEGISFFSATTIKIKDNLSKVVKQIAKMGLALVGISGVYGSIRKAMSTYLAQNEELQNKLNGAWYALGSMFAPVLEWIINKFVYLVSLVDALAKSLGFAGVNMAKYGKAGAKASKQLAGFDEINNLNSQSGGGGTSGLQLPDVTDDALRKFKTIATLIASIGAGLLAWKIASSFSEALGWTVGQCIGLGLAVAGVTAYVLAFVDAWTNGIDWHNLALMIGGVTLAMLALSLAFSPTLGGIVAIVGGIGLLVLGIKDFIRTGEMTKPVFTAIWAGCALIGAGISLITGSWIPMLIGLIVGILLPTIMENWDKIKEKCDELKDKFGDMKDKIAGHLRQFKTDISNTVTDIVQKFTDLKNKAGEKMDELKRKVVEKWESLKTWWQNQSLGSFRIKVPHFHVSGSFGWSWDGGLSIPHISVDWYKKGGIFSGPQIIGVGEYGDAKNNPEVVAPLNTLSDMIGNNSKTDELLEQLIDIVDTKEFRAYISQNEIGKTAVKYINSQSRIKGGSIV